MPMMSGMEHPAITLGVPPLVDPRILIQFCHAITRYADGTGFQAEAADAILRLQSRLNSLANLAELCRMTVLGLPESFPRLRDEMICLAVDFPADPLQAPACGASDEDEADDRVQLGSVFDLLAGAAFVSKGDNARRDRLITGVVRAVADAICYPLAYSREAATYLSGGSSKVTWTHAEIVIANAAQRLIESDYRCDPLVPPGVLAKLERMAARWQAANPVTAMFDALVGPQLDRIIQAVTPDDVKPGDQVALQLRPDCVARPRVTGPRDEEEGGVYALFCPTQMAEVLSQGDGRVEVRVPAYARTGPVALVRKPSLEDVEYLLSRYACEFPAEWAASLFSFIPMWKWAYPTAFGCPVVEVTQVPVQASVGAWVAAGPVSASRQVELNQPVYIHYEVDPPGSDENAPLLVSAALGPTVRKSPGMIVYTPAEAGDDAIVLSWGSLTEVVQVHVVRPLS
jgi:hypothetical protein